MPAGLLIGPQAQKFLALGACPKSSATIPSIGNVLAEVPQNLISLGPDLLAGSASSCYMQSSQQSRLNELKLAKQQTRGALHNCISCGYNLAACACSTSFPGMLVHAHSGWQAGIHDGA